MSDKPSETTPQDGDNKASAHTANTANKSTPLPRLAYQALFTLLAVALFITVTYVLLTNLKQQTTQNQHDQLLQTALTALTARQEQLAVNLNAMTQRLQSQQKTLQSQLHALSKQVETHSNVDTTLNQPWVLKKARYYLELAQINQHWSTDNATTVALLEEANALLQPIPDERLISIRQTLAKETESLKSITPVNVAEVMSQLSAAQTAVLSLPLTPTAPTAKQTLSTASTWRENLQTSLNILEKLVVVRHHDPKEETTFSPLYQSLLREQLSMNLQNAQWAVLQNNETIYQQSLQQILKNLQPYILQKANAREPRAKLNTFLTQIRALQEIKLTPSQPELSQSLIELNDLINTP